MMKMIRGIISAVSENVIKRFAGSGRINETFADREYFQHYGLTSRPPYGAEIITLSQGNVIIGIASDDRRYRVSLQDGEMAIYDNQGQKVHLKQGGAMEVICNGDLTAQVGNQATVTCPTVTVAASSKITLQTPLMEISGNLTVGGTAVVTGAMSSGTSVSDPTGSMQAMRGIYNGHDHNDPQGGTTGTPNQQM